jgi:hypothetical protein
MKAVARKAERLPDLAALAAMPTRDLAAVWLRLRGLPPPRKASREFLLYVVSYDVQAASGGGLRSVTERRLERLVESGENDRTTRRPASRERLRPGTTLVKNWRGRTYRVVVLEHGFTFDGVTYQSLSQIARKISGTPWNGPAFFGLRKGKGRLAQVVSDDR